MSTGNSAPAKIDRVLRYPTSSDFPTTGQKGTWYFAIDTGTPYIWDGSAYQDIDPTTDDIWQRVSTTISPQNAGDDLDLGTGELQFGNATKIYESGADTYIENIAVKDRSINLKLGDTGSTMAVKVLNGSDVTLTQVASDGTVTLGKTGVDSTVSAKNAGGTTTAKLNSNGDSYVNGGKLGLGTNTPNTQLDNQGGETQGVTVVNSATYSVLVTDRDISVQYTDTGAVTITIPQAQDVTGRILEIADDGDNASVYNITIQDDAGTPNVLFTINTDGTSLTIKYNGTEWRLR